ncbi:MAG: hypothetical protein WBO77_03105 [Microgenomates group bacterium]
MSEAPVQTPPVPSAEFAALFSPEIPPLFRDTTDAIRRDTSLIVLRHGEEAEDGNPLSKLSPKGVEQTQTAISHIDSSLKAGGQPYYIKVLSGPKPWAQHTADVMTEFLNSSSTNHSVKAHSRSSLDRGGNLAHYSAMKAELTVRREKGESLDMSDVVWEWDAANKLDPSDDSPATEREKFLNYASHLQRLVDRLDPKGPKIVFVLVTHASICRAVANDRVEPGHGFRLDLPVRDGELPRLITPKGVQEIQYGDQ